MSISSSRASTSGGEHFRRVGFRDEAVVFLGQGRDFGDVRVRPFDRHRIDPPERRNVGVVQTGLGPFPALALAGLVGQSGQLVADQPVQQDHILQPAAAVLGEQVAQHPAPLGLVGLHADEADAPVIDADLGLGHGAADGVNGTILAQLLEHLPLPVLIRADAEGHQLVQGQRPVPIGRHQLRRRRAQPEPLAHHMGRHSEPGADLFGSVALLGGEPLEGLELVGGVHGLTGHVFVEADLVGVVLGVHDDPHRMGPLDRLALGQQPQPLTAPFADGHEVVPGRNALPVPLDLDHGRLQHPLGLDGGREGLDGRRAVRGLPGVPRRGLEPVQRHDHLRAVLRRGRFGLGGLGGLSSHVCLLWAWVAGTRTARLKPCPSARPG